MKKRIINSLWLILLLATLAIAFGIYQLNKQDTSNSIGIGISWVSDNNDFIKGVRLAIEEINNSGGVLGKKVFIKIDDRERKVYRQLSDSASYRIPYRLKKYPIETARGFSKNKNIVAAIGHRSSFLSLAASNVYEDKKVLFLTPVATSNQLTVFDFEYIFRMQPNNALLGKEIADYFHHKNYKRIIVLNQRGQYGQEVSQAFVKQAVETYNIDIISSRSFFSNISTREIIKIAIELKRLPNFDAIFLIADAPLGIKFHHEIHKRGMDIPIVGTENMDTEIFWEKIELWEKTYAKSSQITIPTVLSNIPNYTKIFFDRFYEKYDKIPDRYGVLGYDAIQLVVHGINLAESSQSIQIADELRYMPPCLGITGTYQFSDSGDIQNKPIYFKSLQAHKYQYAFSDGVILTADNSFIKYPIATCGKPDQDRDNIIDYFDKCPRNTPEEISKGVYVEGELQGCAIDSDQDGIFDYLDSCPNNATLEISKGVNEKGCSLDSDNDGIFDYVDKCPGDTTESLILGIDKTGCPTDSDRDKIPDYIDICPNNTLEEIRLGVDNKGCPLDSDNDLIPNYLDTCPKDAPNAINTGIDKSGCPTDTDQDGIADYQDICIANTPLEISKGVDNRGCPKDTDQDGIFDYRDNCLNNTPLEISQGVDKQGCPLDSDGDGIFDYEDDCANNSPLEISKGVNKKGCALDSDNDGIEDYQDNCPNNSPLEISQGVDKKGCSLDSDNDGIEDYADNCPFDDAPTIKKAVDTQGCPKDTDADNVADYLDKCGKTSAFAKVDAQGCPLINKQTFNFQETASFGLNASELNDVAKQNIDAILAKIDINLLAKIEVIAHTDDQGSVSYNRQLSKKRANKVADYLKSKGVNPKIIRIIGKGESEPLTSNATEEGRQKNRRFEILIETYLPKN